MLNLFKLPFKVRNKGKFQDSQAPDFAFGILRNLLRSRPDLSEAEMNQAYEKAQREMNALQQMRGKHDGDYEKMVHSLRKMDKDLDKWI